MTIAIAEIHAAERTHLVNRTVTTGPNKVAQAGAPIIIKPIASDKQRCLFHGPHPTLAHAPKVFMSSGAIQYAALPDLLLTGSRRCPASRYNVTFAGGNKINRVGLLIP